MKWLKVAYLKNIVESLGTVFEVDNMSFTFESTDLSMDQIRPYVDSFIDTYSNEAEQPFSKFGIYNGEHWVDDDKCTYDFSNELNRIVIEQDQVTYVLEHDVEGYRLMIRDSRIEDSYEMGYSDTYLDGTDMCYFIYDSHKLESNFEYVRYQSNGKTKYVLGDKKNNEPGRLFMKYNGETCEFYDLVDDCFMILDDDSFEYIYSGEYGDYSYFNNSESGRYYIGDMPSDPNDEGSGYSCNTEGLTHIGEQKMVFYQIQSLEYIQTE